MNHIERIDVIDGQFRSLLTLKSRFDKRRDEVSGWSVGQHAEHLAMALSAMVVSLVTDRQYEGDTPLSDHKDSVLETGGIPRGAVQAFETAIPGDDDADRIAGALNKALSRLQRVKNLPPAARVRHPMLGMLDRDESLRFIEVHNDHHRRIIDEILRSDM